MTNTIHPHTRNSCRTAGTQRRGAIMIAVLVCLGVAMSLLTVMASRMMLTHRQIRQQAINNQAQLLCQAGIERAKSHAQDDSYDGEIWQIPADELGERGAAEVTITIGKEATVTVTAKFPLNEQMETEFKRKITFENEMTQ